MKAKDLIGKRFKEEASDEPIFVVTGFDGDVVDMDNGQWFDLNGPEGLLAKLEDGRVIEWPEAGLVIEKEASDES